MHIGRLRDRVIFQQEKITSDGGGGGELSWQPMFEAWGELRLEKGRERVQSGRLESATAGVLYVRSSYATRTLTSKNRAVINGVAFQIRSNNNIDRRQRYQELVVEVGVGT